MEKLLNKLIEKGWKPFGIRGEETRIKIERNEDLDMKIFKLDWIIIEQHHRISGSLRNLTSKESLLRQFCCENKLVETDDDYSREKYRYNHGMKKEYKSRVIKGEARKYQVDYEYRIIESALCDEDKLEQFLIENIKVEGK